jgi:hypothetical protein
MSFSPRDISRNRQTNNEVTRDYQGGGNENQKETCDDTKAEDG